MKKALVVANLAGFASFLLNDIKILKKMGYHVSYAANGKKLAWNGTKKALEADSVPFYQVDFDSKNPFAKVNLRAYKQIAKLLKEENFDVIHCHTPIVGMIVRLAAAQYRGKGTRVIYTTHGFSFTSGSSWKSRLIYRTCEDICSRMCDAIITINREDFENAKKLHAPRVFYIHGVGVNTEKYQNVSIDRDAYRKSIGVEPDEIMVLSVGELSHRKNHQIVVEALSRVKSDRKYVYVICGNGIDGGTGRQLTQMAQEKQVDLKLLGFRSDIPQITKCSDVGVIPSIREGLGLAGIQSLAAGIPVAGTNVQGIRDYIEDGNTGFLCDAFDADSFADAIVKLASLMPEDRIRMEQCCVEVSRRFDIAVSHAEMEKIYRELLAE